MAAAASPTLTVVCTSPDTVGTPSTCVATLSGYAGDTDGQPVLFRYASNSDGTGSFSPSTGATTGGCILSSGTCSVTFTPANVGPYLITSGYPGDANNADSITHAAVISTPGAVVSTAGALA